MSKQQGMTLCLRTQDAEEVERGTFEFQIRGAALSDRAFRVGIGSIELPMVQRTIEAEWNRFHLAEPPPLTQALQLTLSERTEMGELLAHIHIPPEVVTVESAERKQGGWLLRCAHDHGLFGTDAVAIVRDPAADEWLRALVQRLDGGDDLSESERKELLRRGLGKVVGKANASTFAAFWWGAPTLVGRFGEISLDDRVASCVPGEPKSLLLSVNEALNFKGAWLRVPGPPSPQTMAELVSAQLRIAALECRWICTYENNTFSLRSETFPDVGDSLSASCWGTLCAHLALPERTAEARRESQPCLIGGSAYMRWSYASLPPGWYGPSHRSMGCGAPPRDICQELDLQLNGILFLPKRELRAGRPSGYAWTWSDGDGVTHSVPVLNGKYTGDTLASTIEFAMNSRSSDGESYAVLFRSGRLVVECEHRDAVTKLVSPRAFQLHLQEADAVPAALLGFDALATYQGSSGYASTQPLPGLRDSRGASVRGLNVYSTSFLPNQSRFSVGHAAMQSFSGVVRKVARDRVTVQAYLRQQPFALFALPNARLEVRPLREVTELLDVDEDGSWTKRAFESEPFRTRTGCVVAHVVAGAPDDGLVTLHLAGASSLLRRGRGIVIRFGVAPYSLCFDPSLPQTLRASHLGFTPGCVAWGEHGSSTVRSASGSWRRLVQLPPFVAQGVHDLDHPDYVLLYLSQPSCGNTSLVHVNGNSVSKPLAKIVLYPLFRHERSLPSDCVLASGESMTRFRLQFRNPDGGGYHFHGKSFSISLNLGFIDP